MIVHGMPAAEYHAHPAISSSLVKRMSESTPAHVRAYLDGPDKQSKAMALGTVAHSAILEPDAVERDYFVASTLPRNTKAGKQAFEFAEDMARHQGQTLVSRADFDTARRMRDSVHAHPEARLVLAKGRPEVSIFAEDPELSMALRSREDWAPDGFDVIVDLKTCRDASPQWFGRDAFRLRYPVSAFHYRHTRQLVTGQVCDFMWIAVESEPPHAVACYYAPADVMLWAETKWREAIGRLRECFGTGLWPAFPEQSTPLPMPAWARQEIEETIL